MKKGDIVKRIAKGGIPPFCFTTNFGFYRIIETFRHGAILKKIKGKDEIYVGKRNIKEFPIFYENIDQETFEQLKWKCVHITINCTEVRKNKYSLYYKYTSPSNNPKEIICVFRNKGCKITACAAVNYIGPTIIELEILEYIDEE